MAQKIYAGAAAALDGLLRDDMLIAAGGFGLCGIPERLLDAIRDSGVAGLTFASKITWASPLIIVKWHMFCGKPGILKKRSLFTNRPFRNGGNLVIAGR